MGQGRFAETIRVVALSEGLSRFVGEARIERRSSAREYRPKLLRHVWSARALVEGLPEHQSSAPTQPFLGGETSLERVDDRLGEAEFSKEPEGGCVVGEHRKPQIGRAAGGRLVDSPREQRPADAKTAIPSLDPESREPLTRKPHRGLCDARDLCQAHDGVTAPGDPPFEIGTGRAMRRQSRVCPADDAECFARLLLRHVFDRYPCAEPAAEAR